jgi:hypothetical protein
LPGDQQLAAQSAIFRDRRIPPTAHLLHDLIEDKTCGKDAVALSQAEMGSVLGLCRRQINRLIGYLKDFGYIVVRRTRRGPAEYKPLRKKPAVSALTTSAIPALSLRAAPVIADPPPAAAPIIPAEDCSLYAGIIYNHSGERPGPHLMGKIHEVERRLDVPEQVMCRWLDEKIGELKARSGGRPFIGILAKAVAEDFPGWLKRNADRIGSLFRERDLERQRRRFAS